MFRFIEKLAIAYISWLLRKDNVTKLEVVIRSDGHTLYDRNFEREAIIKDVKTKASKSS